MWASRCCRPGLLHRSTKAKWREALIRSENALKVKKFESLAEQNQYLIEWEKNVADTRIHGTTKKHVGKQFIEVEKATLGPLPIEPFPIYEEGIRKVSRDGHIEVKDRTFIQRRRSTWAVKYG